MRAWEKQMSPVTVTDTLWLKNFYSAHFTSAQPTLPTRNNQEQLSLSLFFKCIFYKWDGRLFIPSPVRTDSHRLIFGWKKWRRLNWQAAEVLPQALPASKLNLRCPFPCKSTGKGLKSHTEETTVLQLAVVEDPAVKTWLSGRQSKLWGGDRAHLGLGPLGNHSTARQLKPPQSSCFWALSCSKGHQLG